MKKRTLSILLAALMLFSLLPLTATATEIVDSGTCGENLTWTLDSDGLLTISGTGAMEDYTGSAAAPWLSYQSSIKAAEITDGVNSIGKLAFAFCSGMVSVKIADSVISIGSSAFMSCAALEQITLPSEIAEIPSGMFYGCSALTEIVIPNGVTSIGTEAFKSCSGLTDVTLPDRLISIGDEAFNGCSSLKTLDIPNGVETIGNIAFDACDALERLSIPDSVTSIGAHLIGYCLSLKSVELGKGLTTIGETPFIFCPALTKIWVSPENEHFSSDETGAFFNKDKTKLIAFPGGYVGEYTIPDSVTEIDVFAFYDCAAVSKVTIPASVTSIGSSAFRDCDALTDVYFCGDAPVLGDLAFYYFSKSNLTYIPNPNLTLYYIEGKDGWTSPKWNGFSTATWTPNAPLFTDIPEDAWYREAVNYAVANKLMNGVSDGIFRPEGTMTRAMLVTVLWRYAGEPVEGTNTFDDVKDGLWYTKAVAWAAENGIVTGVAEGRFNPDGNITREQLAAILYRYAEKYDIDTSGSAELDSFPDAGSVSVWAKDALQWCVAEGIIGGSNGKLLPQGNATRAQVAAILMRFIENVVNG